MTDSPLSLRGHSKFPARWCGKLTVALEVRAAAAAYRQSKPIAFQNRRFPDGRR